MKRFLKILLWLAGAVVVLLVLAVIGLQLFFPVEKVRALAVEKGSAALGRQIDVEGLDLSFWGGLGVRLQNVRVANPEGMVGDDLLAARDIDLKLRLLPLISGDVSVKRLIIGAPVINLRKFADGSSNYVFAALDTVVPVEAAGKMAPEAKAAAAAISFDALEIRDGRVSFRDDSAGVILDLIALNLATTLGNPRAGYYESAGEVSVDSVKLALKEAYPSIALDLDYRAAYDLDSSLLAVKKADVGVNGLHFMVSGRAQDPLGQVQATGNVKSDRLKVADLINLLPVSMRQKMVDYTIKGDFSLDADVVYDATRGDSALQYSGVATFSDMGMSSRQIEGELRFKRCLVDFEPDNVRLNIEEGSFDGQPLKGHLLVENFAAPVVGGELAGGLNLAFVEPFLPPDAQHRLDGRAAFDLKFSGPIKSPEQLQFSGNFKVTDGRYASTVVPEPLEAINLDLYLENRLANVRSLDCRFPSGDLSFTGRVTDLMPYLMADSIGARAVDPTVEGQVKANVNLALAQRYLPEAGHPTLSGKAAVDLTVAGRIKDPANLSPRGSVAISEAVYTDSALPEPIERLDTRLELRPDTFEVKSLDVKFTSSDVHFSGQLIKPLPYLLPLKDLDRSGMTKPLFLFAATSRRFDTDRLFPEAVPGSAEEAPVLSADSLPAIILPDIDGRGTLKADTVVYCGVEFTNIDAKVKIYDRKIDCYDVTGMVYSGTMTGKTTVDLNDFNNPRYVGEFTASQIEADDFLTRFTKFGGYLFGKTDFSGSFDARGWEPDQFLNSLTLDGNADIRDGKVKMSDKLHNALGQLASLTETSVDAEQALRAFSTLVKVENGRVFTDKMVGKLGALGDFELKGSYGFDETISYSCNLLLSESMSQKLVSGNNLLSGLAGALGGGSSQRVSLPIVIGGSLNDPKVDLDWAAVSKKAGENLSNDAGNFLEGLLKKKK